MRFTLSTRGPAFCPCCGYGLIANAIVLLAFGRTHGHGQYNIAGVCTRCYQQRLGDAVGACHVLSRSLMNEQVHRTYGVLFLVPNFSELDGHTALDIHDHLDCNAPLHQRVLYEPPPPPDPQKLLEFQQFLASGPSADEPPAYDPPCPADIEP